MFLDDLKQLLESREWVGHNLSFDLSFLRYRFKVIRRRPQGPNTKVIPLLWL
jgi:DNA polymerase III epsilon subunit-like protein